MYSYVKDSQYETQYNDFKEFTQQYIQPYANQWDIEECLPRTIIKACADRGYLVSPEKHIFDKLIRG